MATEAELQGKYDEAAAAWGRAVRENPGNTRPFKRRMNAARDALAAAKWQARVPS